MASLVDKDVALNARSPLENSGQSRPSKTYPFEVPMNYSLTVNIDQAPRDVSQLRKSRNRQGQVRVVGQNQNVQAQAYSRRGVLLQTG